MRIAIEGIGVVGGFGSGVKALDSALSRQESIANGASINGSDGAKYIPADCSSLEQFASKRSLRRIDHFSRMALLAAHLALKDAGRLDESRQGIGIVIATGYGASRTTFGFLDSVIDDGDSCASPTLFSNSVHNAAAANISILLNATGPSLTISQFEMSVPSALLSARQWLEERRVDQVLLGGVDEYCEVMGYCWQRFFGLREERQMQPMEFDRQSAVAGEGAAFFLLSGIHHGDQNYGFIKDIQIGNLDREEPKIPENTILFLGADGHRSCSANYVRSIKTDVEVAAYSPLYGSLPVGLAFDMAVAGLTIKGGRVIASPGRHTDDSPLNVIREDQDLDSRPVCCLKMGSEGEFGMVTLAES